MKLVYEHEKGKQEVLVEVIADRKMSVEDILELTQFDLDEWAAGEDYDYNSLKVIA